MRPIRNFEEVVPAGGRAQPNEIAEDDGFNERRAMPLLNSRMLRVVGLVKRFRGLRRGFFAPSLFGEPGWDILLDLFEAELSFRHLTSTRSASGRGFRPRPASGGSARLRNRDLSGESLTTRTAGGYWCS